MCTAATYKTKDFYFGRTLDNDFCYGEEVVVVPRRFPLNFKHIGVSNRHFAMIGMAHVADGYPLFYEAVNEKGLCIAGLNFVGNAKYREYTPGKDNIAVYEFIPWLLSRCENVGDAKKLINGINLIGEKFGDLPAAELHWMIADANDCIVVESVASGINIFDDPVGVLTNNPPFEMQMTELNNYMSLSPGDPQNNFCDKLDLVTYSRGMGAIGLPGDLSSQSRFVRAAFVRANSRSGDGEAESVGQFFHILGSVEQQRGCCIVNGGACEITVYTCCCNATRGIYYCTTYGNSQIEAVDMRRENLDGCEIARYKPTLTENINYRN